MKKTRQKSENLVGFFMRMPPGLKGQLDHVAEQRRCSTAKVIVDMCEHGMRSQSGNDLAQAEIDQEQHGREHISAWLKRAT
tara:strand:+ start:2059 stop:2301 length:243 start_codon:yes stop_codon:yes gene_type:complete